MCPFFFFGGAARGTGTGKDLAPLPDITERFLLVLKPNASVATSEAYRALNAPSLTTAEAKTILSSSAWSGIPDGFDSETLRSDFEPVVFETQPEINRAKVSLMKAGAEAALLAGSGSAVFGIFDSGDAQERAIQAVELESGWRVFPCSTVGRSHYRSAMGPCGAIFERLTGP
jgi:4-diphosphocytidyl-2-C-methyl-D-erythritol kinase